MAHSDWLHKIVQATTKQPDATIRRLIAALESLLAEREAAPEVPESAGRAVVEQRRAGRVTLRLELVNCGKRQCKRCAAGPTHGPYWYAYRKVNGKTRSEYVGKTLDRFHQQSQGERQEEIAFPPGQAG